MSGKVAFKSVAHQDRAARALRSALASGRAAHAYLLCGMEGTGRLALARAACRAILCARPSDGEGCGVCRSCRLFDAGNHPDHLELNIQVYREYIRRRDGKDIDPRDLPIDAVRELVIEPAQHRPVAGRRRTFIIQDADRFSISAANAFLKTLEEPPGGAMFFLIACNTQNIPETIVSRCQTLRLQPVPLEEIRAGLLAAGCAAEEAEWLARFSGGSPARAARARDLGLHEVFTDLSARLDHLQPSDNFALSDCLLERVPGTLSSAEKRELVIFLLECVLYYYHLRASESAAAADLAGGWRLTRAADQAIEAIQAVESNVGLTLALDAMWTRIVMPEAAR